MLRTNSKSALLYMVLLLVVTLMTARLTYLKWRSCGTHTPAALHYCIANSCELCVLCDDFQSLTVRTFFV